MAKSMFNTKFRRYIPPIHAAKPALAMEQATIHPDPDDEPEHQDKDTEK